MRILLDECLPRGLGRHLPGHEVTTVQGEGWSGTKNGVLLRRAAEARIEVFITIDRSLEYQQHVPGLQLAVVALRAPSNDINDLAPLMPEVLAILPLLGPGVLRRIPAQ